MADLNDSLDELLARATAEIAASEELAALAV